MKFRGVTPTLPPRSTAVVSERGTTRRDAHLRTIEKHGRIGWQRRSGYCRRSLIEASMFRYKTIIGRRLHARTLPNQRTVARIGSAVLNRMTHLGMPTSVRLKQATDQRAENRLCDRTVVWNVVNVEPTPAAGKRIFTSDPSTWSGRAPACVSPG